MPSPSAPFDTNYWRKRAEEARSLADGMRDAQTRVMLGIAESYEQIAKSYEKLTELKLHPGEPE